MWLNQKGTWKPGNCHENINQRLMTGLLVLDLRKAFDTVQHDILITNQEHYGIRRLVNRFFKSYLNNRQQYVSINYYNSKLRDISIGVPQGSTLGPLLFLMYINDLPKSINCISRFYADDTCLLVEDKSLDLLKVKLNSKLFKLNNWITANKLTLNCNILTINIIHLRYVSISAVPQVP